MTVCTYKLNLQILLLEKFVKRTLTQYKSDINVVETWPVLLKKSVLSLE